MKRTINELRKKPQHEKERIAFIGSLVATFLIVLFWLVGINANNNFEDQSANVSQPINSIKDQFSNVVDGFRN